MSPALQHLIVCVNHGVGLFLETHKGAFDSFTYLLKYSLEVFHHQLITLDLVSLELVDICLEECFLMAYLHLELNSFLSHS